MCVAHGGGTVHTQPAAMADNAHGPAQPARKRNIRTKRTSEEPEEAQPQAGPSAQQGNGDGQAEAASRIEELRMLQKLRKRPGGTSAAHLADGAKDEQLSFSRTAAAGEEPTGALGGAFSKAKEKVVEDDDAVMSKFVEQELAKRLGKRVGDEEQEDPESKRKRLEAEMYLIPDEYKTILEGDTVVPGMTVVITEVPVSAAVRLGNIEQVEAMKRQLLGIPEEVREQGEVLRRNGFVKSFGRNTLPKLSRDEMESQQQNMKYVSERRPAVSYRQVKKAEQKEQGGGGYTKI